MPRPRHKHLVGGKISFVTKHVCKLDPLELQRELPGIAPFAPSYKKCFYGCFKKWSVASRVHPSCQTYFRSNYALYKERRRQLQDKKYNRVIHPLSRVALFRQMFICVMWVIVFIIDPFIASFLSHYLEDEDEEEVVTNVPEYFQSVVNFILFVDIILQFFIGFQLKHTNEIIIDPRRVRLHYLNTYFLYDFIPVVFDTAIFLTTDVQYVREFLKIPKYIHVWLTIPPFYALRFVRIYSLAIYLGTTLTFFKIRESVIKCITIAVITALVIHWCTCILYFVPTVSYYLGYSLSYSWVLGNVLGTERPLDLIYTDCLLTTLCHFFGAGRANFNTNSQNPFEQLILAFILMCGVSCHIFIIAIVLQLFGTINISETKYEELIYQLDEYMVTKKLPQALRKRLLMYYEYRFQKQFFLEHLILNSLSEHLKYEVILYSCKNLINKVKLFQGAPKDVIGALVPMLKHEIYLPGDQIIKTDGINEHVYFISFGTIAVYLPNGREIYHLEDGHHFGEVQVIMQEYHEEYLASAVAIEITEVFYLDKRDFWYVVATHPEISDSLEKSAMTKLIAYKEQMTEIFTAPHVDTSEILVQLRLGNILEEGRRRV